MTLKNAPVAPNIGRLSSARAAQTIQTVSAALNSGRVASMPELVRIIRTLSQDENAVSVGELAELIEQDSTILVKVISAANTLGYNPTGIRITSVAQAIQVLGFARVRRLAMSLLLLEHAGRSTTPTEQREMAALSLCSGLAAQVAAEHMALVDPEQAFVCASLRNFGRLLLGTFMTSEFAEARDLAEREGDDEAFRSVFGLTPLELGYELLHSASLPEPILNAIRDLPPESLDGSAWAERRLVHVTKFALQLSELVLNPKYDPARFTEAANELVHRYSTELPTLVDIYPDLLAQAEARLTKIARSAGGAALDRYGLDRLRRRVKGHELPARTPAFIVATSGGTATARQGSNPPIPTSIEDACDLLTRDGQRRDAMQIALGAMRASLTPSDAFYCALDSSRGEFRLSHGHGRLSDCMQGEILFRRHERNVFLLCHERLENIVVRDATDTKLQAYLPSWLRSPPAPKSFVLLPVHHQGRVHGVMLVGWPEPQPVQLPADQLALIRKLLALVARANVAV